MTVSFSGDSKALDVANDGVYHLDIANVSQGGQAIAEIGSGGINLAGTNVGVSILAPWTARPELEHAAACLR